MSFIAEAKAWFFRTGAPTNVRGAKINLADKGEPDQDLFERLAESVPFKKEGDDRAKLSTGGALEAEVGIVAATTGAKAKAGTSGLEADRTLVVLAENLPNTIAGINQTITGTFGNYTGPMFTVADNASETDRNVYAITFHADLITFLNTLTAEIDGINVIDAAQTIDIAEIRTTTGTSDGDTNMGVWGGVGTILTDNITTKAALEEIEEYLRTLVSGTGVINDGTNLGTLGTSAQIFLGAGSDDLQFASLRTLSPYLTIVNNVPNEELDFDFDSAGLISALIDPIYAKDGIADAAGTGTANVYNGLDGSRKILFRDLKTADTSALTIINSGADCLFTIQDSYFNNLADARIAAASTPTSSGFLFYALSNLDRAVTSGYLDLSFPNDSSNGGYDQGGSWTVDEYVVNQAMIDHLAAAGTVTFKANLNIELDGVVVSAGDQHQVASRLYVDGNPPVDTDTVIFFDTNLVGDVLTSTLNYGFLLADGLILGDKIRIETKYTNTGAATSTSLVQLNSEFYNTQS